MNKVNLPQLAQEIHAAAVEKGFWDVEDAIEKHCAKMISELGEVAQADRAGVMYEIERDGGKPEGVVAELADFVMMTMDMYMHLLGTFPSDDIETWNENAEAVKPLTELPVYMLVGSLTSTFVALCHVCDNSPMLQIVYAVYKWLQARDYDLWEIIHQKMEYNKSRPALHGRAY